MTDVETSAIVVGYVSKLDDKTIGRVKVKFPHLGHTESDWCPIVSPMAGPERGFVFLPEVGDQVLVALEHGNPNRGFILGAVWSKKQPPPKTSGTPTANNVRFIRSRSGHEVRLDDTKGKEKIEIIDKDVKRKIVIDCSGKKLQILCDEGDVEIVASSGNISVKATSGAVKVEAQTLTLKSSGAASLEAGGALTIKGATVAIN